MRPAPVVTSLVVHVIIALLWSFAFVLYATRMSPVGLGIAAVLLVLQLIGLLGIIRRRSYARTYNAVYFLFWGAFSSLGACAAAGREQDPSLFAWGLFVFLFFGWLALSFALARGSRHTLHPRRHHLSQRPPLRSRHQNLPSPRSDASSRKPQLSVPLARRA